MATSSTFKKIPEPVPVYPPGPKDHFLIGNFPMAGADALGTLASWARIYGDIFHYRFLNLHVYFLNRPEYIEDVLVTNYRLFIKGRGLQGNRRVLGNGLLTSEGDFWRRQRRLCQPAFHRERLEAYARVMVDYTQRMLASWQEGQTLDVHKEMMRLTLEIVAKVLFDADVGGRAGEVGRAMEAIQLQNTRGQMLFPILRSVPTPGNLRYRLAVRRLDKIIYGMIRERRASTRGAAGEGSHNADLFSMLLAAQDEDGNRMTDQQLRDELTTLLLAGHETTALLLSWTWYLMSEHPEVEARLVEELRAVLNGRPPSPRDLSRLAYTEKVIKESLRLYPPAYIIARIAPEGYQVAGYSVPPGSSIVISQWIVHRDWRYFDEPERFNPDRWTEEFEKRLPRFAYFPFGGGPRVCIGSSFAMMEAALLLATIAQEFQLRVVPGHEVVPLPAITLRPKNGVPVMLSKRR